jgi:tetratricopeptide (TPR) repeat protein
MNVFLNRVMTKLGFRREMSASEALDHLNTLKPGQRAAVGLAGQGVCPAQKLWDAGDFDGALAAYTAMLEAAPCVALLYLNRANLLKQMGRTHEALVDYERARHYGPDLPEVLFASEFMIRQLGPDHRSFQRSAARYAARAELTRANQAMN